MPEGQHVCLCDRSGRHARSCHRDSRTIPRVRSDRPGICGCSRSSQRELRELELTPDDIALFNRLAASVVFTNASLRDLQRSRQPPGAGGLVAACAFLATCRSCWLAVTQDDDEPLVRQLVQWRSYIASPAIEVRSRDPGRARRRSRLSGCEPNYSEEPPAKCSASRAACFS